MPHTPVPRIWVGLGPRRRGGWDSTDTLLASLPLSLSPVPFFFQTTTRGYGGVINRLGSWIWVMIVRVRVWRGGRLQLVVMNPKSLGVPLLLVVRLRPRLLLAFWCQGKRRHSWLALTFWTSWLLHGQPLLHPFSALSSMLKPSCMDIPASVPFHSTRRKLPSLPPTAILRIRRSHWPWDRRIVPVLRRSSRDLGPDVDERDVTAVAGDVEVDDEDDGWEAKRVTDRNCWSTLCWNNSITVTWRRMLRRLLSRN